MQLTFSKSETIINPIQRSNLNKKGLCDYVINIASGCLHSPSGLSQKSKVKSQK